MTMDKTDRNNISGNGYRDEKPLGKIGLPQPHQPKSKAARTARDIVTGDILENSKLRSRYPIVMYCIVLVFLYIGHNFNFQRLQRLEIQQKMELNNERSRSMVFSSMRLNTSRHSRITEEIKNRGLKLEESTIPPKKVE